LKTPSRSRTLLTLAGDTAALAATSWPRRSSTVCRMADEVIQQQSLGIVGPEQHLRAARDDLGEAITASPTARR